MHPAVMPLPADRVILPRADEMSSSADTRQARTRSRWRRSHTWTRPWECFGRVDVPIVRLTTVRTFPTPYSKLP